MSQITKERNSNIKIFRPFRKTVLICTNGFQTTDTHDSLPMQEYFNSNFKEEYKDCEIVLVKLFSPSDKKTHKMKVFEENLDNILQEYVKKDYDIILLGYSFSAALVAKMAKKYYQNISRVILVAPVYDTIVNNMIPSYIKYAWKFHKLNKKYGKKVSKAIGRQTVVGLPGLLIAIFGSILKNRKYFKSIKQPVLLIRGDEDILCTTHSIKRVKRALQGENMLYTYEGMTHGILKTVKLNGIVYEDILNFCFDTPYLIQKEEDVLFTKSEEINKVKYDDDGNYIPTFAEIFAEIDPNEDELLDLKENEI